MNMFDIVYTNDDFLIINKYPGVSVHKDETNTILLNEVSQKTGGGSLYLVHRLDKMTSGLLILAKSSNVAAKFGVLFETHRIQKYYLALTEKKPKKKQGLISGDMVRSRRSSWKLLSTQNNPAMTQFFSASTVAGERLFLCRPLTGKTHQIRVALKSIGSPIVGDYVYNPSSVSDRGYLHAYVLSFTLDKKAYVFRCLPNRGELGQRWLSSSVQTLLEEKWNNPMLLTWPKQSQLL